MKPIRWSGDDDRYFGPITYAKDNTRTWAIVLGSGEDDDYPDCRIRFSGFGHTLILRLPNFILRPYREKVKATSWDKATIARMGRDWYWNVDEREYGFRCSESYFQILYGRSTGDSDTDKSRGIFLPWTEWRHVRKSYYDLDGNHYVTENPDAPWRERSAVADNCPRVTFDLEDYDGEVVQAETVIEEMEWRKGSGRFKWLSYFTKPKVERSLSISFSKGVGKRKTSWKGGTTGHAINMLPGELHESAIRRYCAENDMTFVEPVRLWVRNGYEHH